MSKLIREKGLQQLREKDVELCLGGHCSFKRDPQVVMIRASETHRIAWKIYQGIAVRNVFWAASFCKFFNSMGVCRTGALDKRVIDN